MGDGCTIVFDVGKTNAKLSVWTPDGELVARATRANSVQNVGYRALDVAGIDAWLIATLRDFAQRCRVARIVPVGHGAAAVLVQGSRLIAAPMDYEEETPAAERAEYEAQRDSFAQTGSPSLPCGLNLGVQLHRLEKRLGPLPQDVSIVPWPQYWAWRLCGVPASEVTSLGCHTDLWRPLSGEFSALAVRRGWAARMAPIRAAGEVLGTITSEIVSQTGLPPDCVVLCGLHDSNAALLAASGLHELSGADVTVLSTGTWFVAMRSLAANATFDIASLPASRDCLVNANVLGRPVPSARFMGGREAELIGAVDSHALTANYDPDRLISRLPQLIESGACAYPSFVPGVGPFPDAVGAWREKPTDAGDQRAIAGLYLALMANTSLDLIDSRERLLIEGRFAEAVVFARALAALRPGQQVFTAHAHQDVAYGALRLVDPQLRPATELTRVQPLEIDLSDYAAQWRAWAHSAQSAA